MKNIKRNVAVIGVAGLLICMGAPNLQAQRNMRSKKDCPKGIQFSDQQKEQIKESKIEFAKATKDLKNELNELRAHQKTLMSAEKPNIKAIYSNIDKASALKSQLRKEQIAMKLDVKSVLTDDQKVMMANRPVRNKGMRQGRKDRMTTGQGRMNRDAVCNKGGMTQGQRFGNGNANGQGFGRKGMQKDCANSNWMNFSDEQKVQMKEFRFTNMKESKGLRDEAEELQLKQKHLMTSENVDEKLIMENVDRLSGIQNKLAKMKVNQKMEMRKILTEDQLSLFLSHSGMGRGFGNGNGHRHFNN
ncbi:MAG: Spy/CpxP family protein refolding chaperone [Labilibaculum antarcticum]